MLTDPPVFNSRKGLAMNTYENNLYSVSSKYFDDKKNAEKRTLLLYFFVGLGLFCSYIDQVMIGIVFLVVAIWFVFEKKVTDTEYDAAVQLYLFDIKQIALEKLGIDEDEVKEVTPIVFGGYNFDKGTISKLGKDKIWRTNKYEVVCLFFSKNEVHCYSYEFFTTNEKDRKYRENTEVYFYTDIVSVSTSLTTTKLENGVSVEHEFFKLTTKGGTALEVSLTDVEGAKNSINAMRHLLREKKSND